MGDSDASSPSWWSRLAIATTTQPYWDTLFILALLLWEALVCGVIVRRVPYTEIDWQAYMQQVTTFQEGERDYMNIRGGTGPLVYPAGFLYLFTWIQHVCYGGNFSQAADDATEAAAIATAQGLFAGFYLATQVAVWYGVYQPAVTLVRRHTSTGGDSKASMAWSIWSWRVAMACTSLSKRVHSIFVLRLFNDGPTMLLLYISIVLFTRHYWNIGCFVFSLAVSIKMNVLLVAPGLLLLLIQEARLRYTNPLEWCSNVVYRLLVYCATPQIILGLPFLLAHPVHYLRKAFELDRVFFYKWTVNWKFLPEDVFVAKPLSILLLLLHLGGLAYACRHWLHEYSAASLRVGTTDTVRHLSPVYIGATLLVSNYIGICAARTLHYQFYTWYFHALPFLLWYGALSTTTTTTTPARRMYPVGVRLVLLLVIEGAFLTFPATPTSSALLQLAQVAILVQIRPPDPFVSLDATKKHS